VIYDQDVQQYIRKFDIIGSNGENYGCAYCHSNDRLRHLFMYFDAVKFWEKIPGSSILHFAPEKNLVTAIKNFNPAEYILADYYPADDTIRKIDITSIPFEGSAFGLLICCHVLEHIVNYKKALDEIFRVLKPGGTAILQTPYSTVLKRNFEDENINNEELRLSFYAQKDHVRIFGQEQFLMDLAKAGFDLNIIKNNDCFSPEETFRYGVNEKEDLIMVSKPVK
jgi:SAM-dependent methyltransferase